MKNSDLYARLELITSELEHPTSIHDSRVAQVWAQSKTYLGKVGQSLLQYFCGSQEPQITTKRDRRGNTFFVACDPITQAHYTFTSEREVRVWIEQRYYQ